MGPFFLGEILCWFVFSEVGFSGEFLHCIGDLWIIGKLVAK